MKKAPLPAKIKEPLSRFNYSTLRNYFTSRVWVLTYCLEESRQYHENAGNIRRQAIYRFALAVFRWTGAIL